MQKFLNPAAFDVRHSSSSWNGPWIDAEKLRVDGHVLHRLEDSMISTSEKVKRERLTAMLI